MALPHARPDANDRDERLGEAIESYLELAESGRAPEPEAFAASYPDLADELREALDGLALVQGLVGSGVGPGGVGPRRLEAGYRVAGYRIVRELGRGGMGVVYEAVHVDLDRPVALKILGGHATPGSSGRRRFLNEAKTAAGLHHTHIVPVFDVGQVGGLCYYAMQRIEGSGLDRVLRVLRRDRMTASGSPSGRTPAPSTVTLARDDDDATSGLLSVPGLTGDASTSWARGLRLGPAEAPRRDDRPPAFEPPTGSEYYRWVARVGQQAAEALAYAHRRGVVHRDVKPSNLLVDARGIVWVADFGLARRLEDPGQTRGDGLVGTPRYMSPEQAEGRPVDAATDVYSLGATLYELLTLRPPFDGQSTAELVRQIADREPPPPHRFARRLPRDLETIVLKAMAKRPGDRYASASHLADDLGRFLAFEPVQARRISPVGRAWRLARRHPAATIVSTAAAAAILATATVAYIRVANARDQLAEALERQRDATRSEQAARAGELLSHLPVLRASTEPRRRDKGRTKLREAASLAPDEAMRRLLRDEAVELLASQDVEDHPALPTGRVRGLAPLHVAEDVPAGRVAALSEDGETLTLWDVERRRPPVLHQLRPPSPPDDEEGSGPRRGGWNPSFWPTVAMVGPAVAVPNPDGPGVLLVDPEAGSITRLDLDGAAVHGLFAPAGGRRLVTVEAVPPEEADREGPGDDRGRGPSRGPQDRRVRLWDLETIPASPLATLDEQVAAPGERIETRPLVAVDPEGRTIAVGRTSPETRVVIFDAEDGGRLSGFDARIGLTALAIGPEGLIATAGDGKVLLWEVDPWSGDRAIQLPGPNEPQGGYIRQLAFSPSGRLLAALGVNTGVELWDPAANALVAVVTTQGWVQDVAFADGHTLLVASGPITEVWSIADPIGRVSFEFAADSPTRMPAFGPDGLLVMPLYDDGPRVWHADQCPTRARTWDRPEARSAAVAYAPDGHLLAIGPQGLARFDAPADAPPLGVIPWPEPAQDEDPPTFRGIRLLARSPDNRTLLVLRNFESRGDEEPRRDREADGPDPGRRPRRDPDEYWLWLADDDGGPGRLDRLQTPRAAELRVLPPPADPADLPAEGDNLVVVALAGDSLRVRAFDDDGRRILDLDEGDGTPDGRADRVAELKQLLAGRDRGPSPPRDAEERIADAVRGLLAGQPIAIGRAPRPDVPRDPFVPAAVLAPDGRRLFFLDRWLLHGWSIDGDLARPISPPSPGPARSLAISPDGRLLALGRDSGAVDLISTDSFLPVGRVEPPDQGSTRWATAVAFAPDGRLLAVGDAAGTLQLWSLGPPDSPAPSRLFRLPGRRNTVVGLAFSPDGRRLACIDSSEDRVVEAWDLATLRTELASLGLGWGADARGHAGARDSGAEIPETSGSAVRGE